MLWKGSLENPQNIEWFLQEKETKNIFPSKTPFPRLFPPLLSLLPLKTMTTTPLLLTLILLMTTTMTMTMTTPLLPTLILLMTLTMTMTMTTPFLPTLILLMTPMMSSDTIDLGARALIMEADDPLAHWMDLGSHPLCGPPISVFLGFIRSG